MGKKKKIMLGIAAVVFLGALGFFIYFKSVAPPGEEWIAYNNDKLINNIDRQLDGLNMDAIMKEKQDYVVEKSVADIQKSVKEGKLSYEEVTAICLYRIKSLDQSEHGYNSVLAINPKALDEARQRDLNRKAASVDSLYGLPVMLKDNINTSDMPTSGGTVALADFVPEEDADLVKNLKKQGAVMLGKNNLSEFAYYVSSVMPSGYSGNKGQTVNPFGPLKISPSGSSSGSAVAVTANLTAISVGTETDGSIVAPASVNSVVGFKPSRGSVPGEGILPLVKAIDTAGPIAKTVHDAAIAYNALSGKNISLDFDSNSLKGKTIGLLGYEYNDENMLKKLKEQLRSIGANVVDVSMDESGIDIYNLISGSFKKDFEDYAKTYNLPVKKLSELIAFNNADSKRRVKYGQDLLEQANEVEENNLDKINASIKTANSVLNTLFSEKHLDGMVFLNSAGSTSAAAAGFPELTIPFGTDGKKVPQGATFVTQKGHDKELLNMGFSFEEAVQGRQTL